MNPQSYPVVVPERWPGTVLPVLVIELLRENPVNQVLDFSRILGVDDLVVFFRAVLELYLWPRGYILWHLLFAFGFLALVFGGDLLIRRAFLGLVDGVALEAIVLFGQRLGRLRVDGG